MLAHQCDWPVKPAGEGMRTTSLGRGGAGGAGRGLKEEATPADTWRRGEGGAVRGEGRGAGGGARGPEEEAMWRPGSNTARAARRRREGRREGSRRRRLRPGGGGNACSDVAMQHGKGGRRRRVRGRREGRRLQGEKKEVTARVWGIVVFICGPMWVIFIELVVNRAWIVPTI
jgi:hypothetical protein